MKKDKSEWASTNAMGPDGELTLEKLVEAYNLMPPPIDVWEELARQYNMNLKLGDLLIISTEDQDLIIEWGLEIPTWVKFSICIPKGETIVVRASAVFGKIL